MEKAINSAYLEDDYTGYRVRKRLYNIYDPDGNVILPSSWETHVKPGMNLEMRMFPLPRTQPERKREAKAGPDGLPTPSPLRSSRPKTSHPKATTSGLPTIEEASASCDKYAIEKSRSDRTKPVATVSPTPKEASAGSGHYAIECARSNRITRVSFFPPPQSRLTQGQAGSDNYDIEEPRVIARLSYFPLPQSRLTQGQ